MKFPRYWARAFHETKDPSGATLKCSSVRWSGVSVADAYAEATRFARKLAQAILAGDPPVSYPYGDRPLCEERIREIEFESGTPAALITRIVTRHVSALFSWTTTSPPTISQSWPRC